MCLVQWTCSFVLIVCMMIVSGFVRNVVTQETHYMSMAQVVDP
jgi:hypothetical protein